MLRLLKAPEKNLTHLMSTDSGGNLAGPQTLRSSAPPPLGALLLGQRHAALMRAGGYRATAHASCLL